MKTPRLPPGLTAAPSPSREARARLAFGNWARRCLLFAGFLIQAAAAPAQQVFPPDTRFVMSHFGGNAGGGDERLYISFSPDGLNWTALNGGQPVWESPDHARLGHVVRDPSIVFAHGFYWVAYTSGSYGRHDTFGLVKSSDLLNWTFVGEIDAALPGATDPLTWGPFFFEDGDGSIHLFVGISPINGAQFNPTPAMRSYELHPLNAGFSEWSAPVLVDLPSTNTNEFWVWKIGDRYHGIFVDFTRGGAVVHASSSDLVTGWVFERQLGFNSQEGGFVLPIPDGGHRLYLEPGNAAPVPGYRTTDFNPAFDTPSPQVLLNATVPMRNGKVTLARNTEDFAGWQSRTLSSADPADRGPDRDPDSDGLENLLECLAGTDPLAPQDRPELFRRTLGMEEFIGLRFAATRRMRDVDFRVETMENAGPWTESALIESRTIMSDGRERIHARDPRAPGGATARFLRLKAVLQSPAPAIGSAAAPPVLKARKVRTKECRGPAQPRGR